MSITQANESVIRLFTFRNLFMGRLGRLNFLIGFIVISLAAVFCGDADDGSVLGSQTLGFALDIIVLIACASLTLRRLHDTNRGGGCALLMLIPIFGFFYFIAFFFISGTNGENRFGARPEEEAGVINILLGKAK